MATAAAAITTLSLHFDFQKNSLDKSDKLQRKGLHSHQIYPYSDNLKYCEFTQIVHILKKRFVSFCEPSSEMSAATTEQLDTWGQPGHLTAVQEEALKQFREQVEISNLNKAKFRVESEENVSLRFLRARQFNVANALQLLQECVKKREELKADYWAQRSPDECANCNVDAMKKWYPHGDFGFDKFNRPILYELSGHVEGAAIYQMTTLDHCINYHWWTMEYSLNRMFDEAATRGPVIISTCAVLDLTGLNSSHASNTILNHVKAMIAIDNVCYPETLGKMLVVNAPWLAGKDHSFVLVKFSLIAIFFVFLSKSVGNGQRLVGSSYSS